LYGVKSVALSGTFCSLDDGMNQQRIFGHSLRHQQNAFWDAKTLAQCITTAFLQCQSYINKFEVRSCCTVIYEVIKDRQIICWCCF